VAEETIYGLTRTAASNGTLRRPPRIDVE
jgi:hypothetical protein